MTPTGNASFKRTVLRYNRRMWLRRALGSWPFLVWLALVALCAALYLGSAQYGLLPGNCVPIHNNVAPVQPARVKAIFVKIGEPVTNGQLLVQMDTTLIDEQLAQAEATLIAAQNTTANYEEQMLALVQTFDNAILNSQTLIEQQRNLRESDTARLTELKSIQATRDTMTKSNLIPEPLIDALRPEIAALEKTVAAYPAMIAQYERTLENQRKLRADLQHALRLGPDGDIRKAIAEKTAAEVKILQSVVDLRKQEKLDYSLRASTNGVVADLLIAAGDVAQAGAPILQVVSDSHLILGYLPEFRMGRMKVGERGYAFRMGQPPVKVRVVSVLPEINPVPVKFNPISAPLGITFRSQKIVFKTEEESTIIPGEKVQIRITSEWWAKVRYWLGGSH